MRMLALISVTWCLAISGCVSSSSVCPILSDADESHDVDLNGTWRQIDVKESPNQHRLPDFTCEGKEEDAHYNLTLIMPQAEKLRTGLKSIPTKYDIVVGNIGCEQYLQARRSEITQDVFFEGVVTYTFAKIAIKDDVILLYPINDQSLKALLPKTSMAYFNHNPSGWGWALNIVITESTPRLQQFLKQHHESLFYSKPIKFRRITMKANELVPAPEPTR